MSRRSTSALAARARPAPCAAGLLTALTALTALAACPGPGQKPGPTDRPGTAATVEVSLAEVGLETASLDRAADPCGDFFQYACGGWLAANEIPPDLARWGRFSEIDRTNEDAIKTLLDAAAAAPKTDLDRKLGDYYASCLDEPALEARGTSGVKPLLDAIAKVSDAKSLGPAITALHKHRVFVLWDVFAEADFKDSTTNILFLDTSGLGLPDRDYYLQDAYADKRATYLAHVEKMLALAGKGKAAAGLAADVVALETALAKATKTRDERVDVEGMYHPTDTAGLAAMLPGFDWTTYFAALGNPAPGKLSVTTAGYLAAVAGLMRSVKPAVWQAYLTVHVLDGAALALPRAFDDETFALQAALSGVTEQRDRWKRCVDATSSALPELLGQAYVAAYFPGESKDTATKLIAAIADVMNEQMGTLPWMTDATRQAARGKLAKIEALVGYPDAWRAYDFAIARTDFGRNELEAAAFEGRRQIGKGGKPYDRDEWLMPAYIVNAYYNANANNTALPAGILQPPFFGKDRSIAANLGGIGMVVGHELTHGFDDQGAKFDAEGNLENWWQPDDKTQFEARGQCLATQYATFEVLPGRFVNGETTLGENIADLGGIKHAFLAYRKLRAGADQTYVAEGLSEDQQFFVGVGQAWCSKDRDAEAERRLKVDSHSPPRWRVNGALRNLPQFAQAFGCQAGAAMAPKDACAIW